MSRRRTFGFLLGATLVVTGVAGTASAQLARSPAAPSAAISSSLSGSSQLQRLQQEVADNNGRISSLQIAVQRAAHTYTQCLGGLTFQCTAPNVSTNAQGGSQDCSPYTCNAATGLCQAPFTCKTSDDCSGGTSCDPINGSCHPPVNGTN